MRGSAHLYQPRDQDRHRILQYLTEHESTEQDKVGEVYRAVEKIIMLEVITKVKLDVVCLELYFDNGCR
jgi:hypothetical protein